MQQIAEGIFVEQGLAPYNLGLIQTAGGALLVDVPAREEALKRWLEMAQAQAGKVRAVVLTDAAPERLLALSACKIPVIASEATLRRVDALRADERAWAEFVGAHARRLHLEAESLFKRLPTRISVGVRRTVALHWRSQPILVEIAPGGPQPGSVWVWLPDARMLFTGDTVILGEPPLYPVGEAWETWEMLMRELNRHPVARLVPGRGVVSAYAGDLETLQEFLRALQITAQRLARAPQTSPGELQRAASDLQQGFFPHIGARSEPALRLRALLECQIAHYRQETCAETPEA